MNQRVAKMIRKEVFKDLSKRQKDYGIIPHIKKVIQEIKGEKKEVEINHGQAICTGLRATYKKVKNEYKRIKREGRNEDWRVSPILSERKEGKKFNDRGSDKDK